MQALGPSGVDARSSVGHVRRVVVAGCGGGGLQMVDSGGGASGAVPGSGGSLSARLPVCSRIATEVAASHHRRDWGRDGGQGAVPPPITPTTSDVRPLRRLRRLLRTGLGCFPLV